MTDLQDLAEAEHDDQELVPDILPVDIRLHLSANTSDLVSMFERAASIAPAREVIKGTGQALLEAFAPTKEGPSQAVVTATDGVRAIRTMRENNEVLVPGSVLVPPKKIFEVLKSAPQINTKIEVVGQTMHIRSGRARWTITLTPDAISPYLPNVELIETTPLPRESLLKALTFTRRATGTNSGRQALQQVHIKDGKVTGTDGKRVHRYGPLGLDPDWETTILLSTVDEVVKHLRASSQEYVGVGGDARHVVFQIGSDMIISKRDLLAFPHAEIERVLLESLFSNQHRLVAKTQTLIEAIKRVRLGASPEFPAIYLEILPGKADANGDKTYILLIKAEGPAGGAQEAMKVQWNGPDKILGLSLNHKMLLDMLADYDSEYTSFSVGISTPKLRLPLLIEDQPGFYIALLQQMSPHQ